MSNEIGAIRQELYVLAIMAPTRTDKDWKLIHVLIWHRWSP